MMYKVLIVDDERLIREGLRTLIDWETYGFQVEDTASDGWDALNKLPELAPDLIIADIRMPGMDGLTLMHRVRSEQAHAPRFIFLSGYADFDYAREALRMKAEGYMLKPVDEDELIDHLGKVKQTLDEAREAAGGQAGAAADAGVGEKRPNRNWLDTAEYLNSGEHDGKEEMEPPDVAAAEEKLTLALDIGDAETAAVHLRSLGEAMLAARLAEQSVKAVFARILTETITALSRHHPEIREQEPALSTELFESLNEERYSVLLQRLVRLTADIAGRMQPYGSDQQVRKMTDLIHRNYAQPLKLETLAELLNYNTSYLGKLFKSATGDHFNTYLDKVRIEKAKELLTQGMKVYQVAEEVGYSNVDYFHGKFRKYVGESPSSFRKKE